MTPVGPPAASSPRGDRRREALLAALDDRLRTTALDDISVADLTDAAGITRSAFYFYFDSKAAAVSVLLVVVNEEARASTEMIVGGADAFRARVTAALSLLVERVLDSGHIYRALLTARTTHDATREMWDEGRRILAAPIADFLRAERAAGRAPEGADATVLAESLIHINESVLERLVYVPDAPREPLIATAADMWVRAVYGRPDPAVDAAADPGRTE
ncbi:TetR/AcrR family transcriptional regulator [Dietzia sp. UBA5065]|uniref:TetR/AcrR family transcriptional regulator n=1 Tax=Dietzia sp. UBA5065 TaxID=1946422 RepID=UPI0025BE340A|nr:TetR/AcrR family transcriptional regulator [Dietzia sp. UBA5065]